MGGTARAGCTVTGKDAVLGKGPHADEVAGTRPSGRPCVPMNPSTRCDQSQMGPKRLAPKSD
eukprot:11484648-Alexandrium_andersonii.AAC.1